MSKLRVWHIPQVPMKPIYFHVKSPEEGVRILEILAHYDQFQFNNRIKPDYCNAGGLQEWDEEEKEWLDWCNEGGEDVDHIAAPAYLDEEVQDG